jgi:hypothetical protein
VEPFVSLQFLNSKTLGRTFWAGDQPVARLLPAHRTSQAQNKRTHTSMSEVGFEPTIPGFERLKKVHGVDSAATVIGKFFIKLMLTCFFKQFLLTNRLI